MGHLGVGRRYPDTTSLLTPRRLALPVPPLPDFNQLRAEAQQLEQQAAARARVRPLPAPATPSTTSPVFVLLPAEQARREQQELQRLLNEHNRAVQAATYLPDFLRRALTLSPVNLTAAPPTGKDTFMPTSFWKSQAPNWANCAGTVYAMLAAYYGKNYHQPLNRYDLVQEHRTAAKLHGFPVRDYYVAAPATRASQGMSKLDEYMAAHKPVMVGVSHTLNFYLPTKHKNRPTTYSAINDGTIDHFVALVGTGVDKKGKYYRFFDVGTKFLKKGTDPKNRLYYNPATGFYEGQSVATGNKYVLTQVRF